MVRGNLQISINYIKPALFSLFFLVERAESGCTNQYIGQVLRDLYIYIYIYIYFFFFPNLKTWNSLKECI